MGDYQFIQDLGVVLLVASAAGWLFHRMGLSVVVGYLLAGIIIGPYTPPFPLVQDIDRIETLANVGLVFLMFTIGMGLSFRRLQRLGLSIVLATALIAFLLFNFWRGVGMMIGFTELQSLFFAAMWVSSSSAIIGKVLQEKGLAHRRSGQLALGVTVLEDVVAVVTLTLLISYAGLGGETSGGVWGTIGFFGAFVVFIAIAGLLIIPRLLIILGRRSSGEVEIIFVAAFLLLMALLAQEIGYSLALGAFLAGAILAETTEKAHVERAFEGLRYVFSAVFFVAIGMMIDLTVVAGVWHLILMVAGLTVVARIGAAYCGLVLIGAPPGAALRAGMALTPMGEFGFIIAQAGIIAAVVPESFYALAVGVSLLTALICPVLVTHADAVAGRLEKLQPSVLRNAILLYHGWLERIAGLSGKNLLWSLIRRPILQISLGLFFVAGLLALAATSQPVLERLWRFEGIPVEAFKLIYWSGVTVLALLPVLGVWRNLGALSMILAEVTTRGLSNRRLLTFTIEMGLKLGVVVFLVIWYLFFIPFGAGNIVWVLLASAIVGGMAIFFFHRRFTRLHSQLEQELRHRLGEASPDMEQAWLHVPKAWDLNLEEYLLPDAAVAAGRSIGELQLRKQHGCSVVGIDRQGHLIETPGPDVRLYPGDRLLLLGNATEIAAGRDFLDTSRHMAVAPDISQELTMEPVVVSPGSPSDGKTLADLDLQKQHSVQVAAIKRDGRVVNNPQAGQTIHSGDELLIVGLPDRIRDFERWIHGQAD